MTTENPFDGREYDGRVFRRRHEELLHRKIVPAGAEVMAAGPSGELANS